METLQAGQFYSPLKQTLIKASEEDGRWVVYLEASNQGQDLDGEQTMQKALSAAAPYFLEHGVLSWDHKHKELNDPQYIVGEPKDVAFDSDSTLVKGILYKENKLSQGIMQNLLSESTRLGASVGGFVLAKSGNQITRVFWDETAITHKPVNSSTQGRVSIVPFQVFAKALMAGDGVDASTFVGGRALIPENLMGAISSATPEIFHRDFTTTDRDVEKLFNDLWVEVQSGQIEDFRDLFSFILMRGYSSGVAVEIARILNERLPQTLADAAVGR